MMQLDTTAVLAVLGMIALMALTSLAAPRLRTPQSILLVLIGAGVAFIPGVPRVQLDPELVLLLMLPPLLYTSGVGMSWRGFRDNLGAISLMAVGCVVFTAVCVAATMHWILDMPWSVGLVLGAVVSPPDPVAPMAIARRLSVPNTLLIVLEGEGLVNDATALILLSLAVAAVSTGAPIQLLHAAGQFAVIVAGEIAWGLLLGYSLLRLRRWAGNSEVEMVLALLTPYLAFWPPHFLGGSGVLAAVTAGLYASWNGRRLISPATRLQGFFVWGLVVYLVEGLVFLLTGLHSRVVVEATRSWPTTLGSAALTTVAIVVVRLAWVFFAAYLPKLLMHRNGRGRPPSWRATALIGFTGIRGVVSLIAALSIPEMVGGAPFPDRDLILFVAFAVILVTLVGQGSALPVLIRALRIDAVGLAENRAHKREEVSARIVGIEAAQSRLSQLEAGGAAARLISNLRRLEQDRRIDFLQTRDEKIEGEPVADAAELHLELIEAERAAVNRENAEGALSDEARRRIERELDLEDARVRHTAASATFDETGVPPEARTDSLVGELGTLDEQNS